MNYRAAITATAVVATATLAAVVIQAGPADAPTGFPPSGTVEVMTPHLAHPEPYQGGAQHPSASPAKPAPTKGPHTSREGRREPLRPAARSVTLPAYTDCSGYAQSCIDKGLLTKYNGNFLAGHDYKGFRYLATLAVGTRVNIPSGPLAGEYVVFAHTETQLARNGGTFPNTQGAAVVLQSCLPTMTGFSLLRRA